MENWLFNLTHWHWWILAIVLLVVETIAPGAWFLWFAVSAAVTGIVLLIFSGLQWEYQFLFFAVTAVVTVLAWRRYQKLNPVTSDQPSLNRRGEQYIGRRFTLTEPIVNGVGKIKVDDSTWRIQGADQLSGTTVSIVGVDGVVLKVESVEDQPQA